MATPQIQDDSLLGMPSRRNDLADLLDAVVAYEAAVRRHTMLVGAASTLEQRTSELRLADAATAARLEVYNCLVRQGWRPPDAVVRAMSRDTDVVRLSVNVLA